jgi:hypothetical protein
MADQFSVSPDSIDQSSQEFFAVSDTARRILGDTRSGLTELSPIAGPDHYGELFNKNFVPGVNSVEEVLQGTSDGMFQTTTDLQTTAEFYRKANELNTDLPTRLV